MLDAWIRIDADGRVTVFTGKAELGQGIKTALIQVAAEELTSSPRAIELVTADTARTPERGLHRRQPVDAGQRHGDLPRRRAGARVLVDAGGAAAGASRPSSSTVQDGASPRATAAASATASWSPASTLHVRAQPKSPLQATDAYRIVMGKPMPRVDIPAKVTGRPIYVQDLRLPGMVHARVVRPPSYGARLRRVDAGAVEAMPGVSRSCATAASSRVVAEREYQAVKAMRALARRANGTSARPCPTRAGSTTRCAACRRRTRSSTSAAAGARRRAHARGDLPRPYQMHGSIGPSCAVALLQDDALTVWTHSQGVYPAARAIAEMLGCRRAGALHPHGGRGLLRPQRRRRRGGRCGAVARALPGRPVRVQWMREQEHALGALRLGHGRRRRAAARRRRAHRGLALRGLEQHALDAARAARRPARRAASCRALRAADRRSRCRSRRAAATATRSRSTRSRARASCTTSCPTCRCGSRRCGRSART